MLLQQEVDVIISTFHRTGIRKLNFTNFNVPIFLNRSRCDRMGSTLLPEVYPGVKDQKQEPKSYPPENKPTEKSFLFAL